MYEKQLIQAGLTEKQAKIYLACLELGKAKVPEIARKSGIKRTTAYGILDELAALGLVSLFSKGKMKFFQAQEPGAILGIIENRKKVMEAILPDLNHLLASYGLRPRLQFFEGREGVKRIYEDTLKCRSKKVQQIVRVKDFIEFAGRQFSASYIKRRAENNIVSYALHPKSDDVHDEVYGQESDRWKRHVRYLPPNMFYASMIMIYDFKVAMISTTAENFGFIIESKEFSNTLRSYFDFLWQLGSKEAD
ncbi:MAG: helix-turn-helix domain-containing protein [Patescibacteria group bacterium]